MIGTMQYGWGNANRVSEATVLNPCVVAVNCTFNNGEFNVIGLCIVFAIVNNLICWDCIIGMMQYEG